MPSIKAATYVDHNQIDGTSPDRWNGSSPVMAEMPDAGAALEAAARIQDNLRKTFDRCMDMVDTWSQLRNYYEGPDQDTVYSAFEERLGRIASLRLAGDDLFDAFQTLATKLQSTVEQRQSDYCLWAVSYKNRVVEHEPILGEWCRGVITDIFSLYERLGIDPHDPATKGEAERIHRKFAGLKTERLNQFEVATGIVRDIDAARDEATDSIQEIDLDGLSELRFETRDEATETLSSQQDVEEMLWNSELINELEFSSEAEKRETIQRLAAEIWAERASFSSGQVVDAKDRGWVMTSEGTLVRSGSVMDSRVTSIVLQELGEDETTRGMEILLPGMTGYDGPVTVEALVDSLDLGNDGFIEWGTGAMDTKTNKALMGANGALISGALVVAGAGAAAKQHREGQAALYPIMSVEDLDERESRQFYVELVSGGASGVVGAGATAVLVVAGAPAGGVGGVVVAYIVDAITGEIVGMIVEAIDDQLTTTSREKIDDMSDEELAEAG